MTDNRSPADVNATSEPADEFPSRLRVHALARTLGLTSREVLAHLVDLGDAARSAQSSIDSATAQAVADRVRRDAATPTSNAPSAATEPPQDASTAAPALFSAPSTETTEPAHAAGELGTSPLFLPPQETEAPARAPKRSDTKGGGKPSSGVGAEGVGAEGVGAESSSASASSAGAEDTGAGTGSADADTTQSADDADHSGDDGEGPNRNRRRRRGRRGRGRGRGEQQNGDGDTDDTPSSDRGDAEPDGTGLTSAESADADGAKDGDRDTGQQTRPSGKRNKKRSGAGPGNTDGKSTDADDSGKDRAKTAASPSGDGASDSPTKPKKSKKDSTDGKDTVDSDNTADRDDESSDGSSTKRRRRRRRRKGGGDGDDSSTDDPPNTVVHEREPRSKKARDEVQGISGSTRLEAKRQRRRDGRDAGRRRPPILSESEFLARREAVDRVMVVRERGANGALGHTGGAHDPAAVEDYTQVAVLEDGVLVEHFVTTATSSSMVGNIYLGRVQNVLPGMEAAFVDIGRGRNGVLYAGEVNWEAAGLGGGSRKIEQALKPGDNVVVQVSKDPVGHKGARLTTQISLAGRYLVYVPGGSSTGISRKLPDVERKRLKQVLAKLVPDNAGVIIRTASEGVSSDDLGADIERLAVKWASIDSAATEAQKGSGSSSPRPLYEEPDLLVRVVRDLFNEDFKRLVVEGERSWDLVQGYVSSVAPDLMDRVERFTKPHADAPDSFVVHRIDEQLAKALDRKVWLPSGGTLIIEHTEAMTVVDVNTGKFTGSGGNLEETVTRNNLEAAEEIVRQMRLRDIGGMIIVDFIDMVLESNRDLVLRRLTEALARDRTRHQVSEVTSLGLVQMTRKRLGTGLLEAFSTTCTACAGRGVIVHSSPVEVKGSDDTARSEGSSKRRRGKKKSAPAPEPKPAHNPAEHPMFRAMAAHSHEEDGHPSADGAVGAATTQAGATTDIEVRAPADSVDVADVDSHNGSKQPVEQQPDVSSPAASDDQPGSSDQPNGVTPRRRRRAVRRPASPTGHADTPEPVGVTAPVTTGGPVTSSGPSASGGPVAVAEPDASVRRRPRRRSGHRAAGPPVED